MEESKKVMHARIFAEVAHVEQQRKYTGEPYITHPKEVVEKLQSVQIEDEDIICAAWLHDVLEDCPMDRQAFYDLIPVHCGEKVVALVEELTEASLGSTENRAVRKKMDRDKLALASKEAKTIKLADRICNLKDMKLAPTGFQRKYLVESALLLEVLRGANQQLEQELESLIHNYVIVS